MRRRSRASSKLAKARSRKTVKRRTTSKDVRRPSSSASRKTGAAQLARERDEALEQLSGASEVLKVIGSSSGDLKPVFQTMLAEAVGLCKFGVLWLREGDRFRSVALHNVPVSQRQAREREPLVVEDQPDNRQIIRDMLAPTDYEITEAESGEEALVAIAKQRPDLILMDIQLPIMDGYTATRRIKAARIMGYLPVIVSDSAGQKPAQVYFEEKLGRTRSPLRP